MLIANDSQGRGSVGSMKYSIIKADIYNAKREILALWKRNALPLPEERFSWMYENNPAGPAMCHLAVERETDSVIGAAGLFPRWVLINGKPKRAGVVGDFVIDKYHRGFGPALALDKATTSQSERENFEILYGFPNELSRPVLLRGGWKILGSTARLTKPLRSFSHAKKHIDIPILTGPASKCIDLIMKLSSKEMYRRRSEDYLFQNLNTFDRRFDELWAKASGQFPIIGVRDSSYLTWRFQHHPEKCYLISILMRKQSDEILGYIIYYKDGERSQIEDLFFLEEGEILDCLIFEFLACQRKERIDFITFNYLGAPRMAKKFMEYGFFLRGDDYPVLVYAPSNSAFLSDVLEVGKCHLACGDRDI